MREGITQLEQQGLGIAEAASLTPFSESSLYRIAPREDSPFTKRCGRWVTTPEKLKEWIETGPKPRRESISADPMPGPRKRSSNSFRAQVVGLHSRRAS